MPDSILVLNAGSSSLKFGLYEQGGDDERLILDGLADEIGQSICRLEVRDPDGNVLRSELMPSATQEQTLERAARWIAELSADPPTAVGHRVVHGGAHLIVHQRITPEVIKTLKDSIDLAPLHIPVALQLIEEAGRLYAAVPQFACFDTAFHSTLPEIAKRFALPRQLFEQGIRRYGFHGLSYESIVHELGAELPGRTVIAHLGNGASLAAVSNGRSVDTTMGLTPTGGIPMASRSGDLDPGVILYLLRVEHATAETLEQLLDHESGLKGLSDGKTDMRDLEAAAHEGDAEAKLAIEIFCASIRKTVAAYAAVLEGIDLLVFTGGIGEHSAEVRKTVCAGLGFLGIAFDEAANHAHSSSITTQRSKVQVRVIVSKEDVQIARHCRRMLGGNGNQAGASSPK